MNACLWQGNGCNGDYTTNECSLLGFNKANLLCSSCDQLKKFQLTSLKYKYYFETIFKFCPVFNMYLHLKQCKLVLLCKIH